MSGRTCFIIFEEVLLLAIVDRNTTSELCIATSAAANRLTLNSPINSLVSVPLIGTVRYGILRPVTALLLTTGFGTDTDSRSHGLWSYVSITCVVANTNGRPQGPVKRFMSTIIDCDIS